MSADSTSPRPAPGKYQGQVLVVDDEAPVREIAALVLQHLGFGVDTAADAGTALELLKTDPQRYALFLVDMTLPGEDGVALVGDLRRGGAAAPVVLMSGYAEQQIRKQTAFAEGVTFLPKPFDYGALRAAVDTALRYRT